MRSLVVLALALVACGGSHPRTPADAGSTDAGSTDATITPDGARVDALTPPDAAPPSPDAVPPPDAAKPSVTGLAILNRSVLEARQNEKIVVVLTGANLTLVSAVTVDGAPASISSQTDAEIDARITIAADATPGPREVFADTIDAGAISVTPITVSASGSDAAPGTTTAPYATLDVALSASGVGSTIEIGAGTFAGNLSSLAGVTLEGAGTGATILQAGYQTTGATTLRSLTLVGNSNRALDVANGSLALVQVAVAATASPPTSCLSATGQPVTITITGSSISGCPRAFFAITASSTFTVDTSDLTGDVGVQYAPGDASTLSITGSTIHDCKTAGMLLYPNAGPVTGTVTVKGTSFTNNDLGVHLRFDDIGKLDFADAGNSFSDVTWDVEDDRNSRAAADGVVADFTGALFQGAAQTTTAYTGPTSVGAKILTISGTNVRDQL